MDQAMPNMDDTVRQTLLLHQFVAGLQITISRQLQAAGKTRELNSVLDPARLLMTMEKQCSKNAAVCDKTVSILQQLQIQVDILSEQVALQNAVDVKQAKSSRVRCFNCNKIGHTQENDQNGL